MSLGDIYTRFICPRCHGVIKIMAPYYEDFWGCDKCGRRFTRSELMGGIPTTADRGNIICNDPDRIHTVSNIDLNESKVYVGAKALHIKKGTVCEIIIEDGADVTIKTVRGEE